MVAMAMEDAGEKGTTLLLSTLSMLTLYKSAQVETKTLTEN